MLHEHLNHNVSLGLYSGARMNEKI
jgi:hypothetical protein